MKNYPAPQEPLKMIFYNCKKACNVSCTCWKLGLQRHSTCEVCSSNNCEKNASITDQDSEFDSEDSDFN